jgi:hypothetical protein
VTSTVVAFLPSSFNNPLVCSRAAVGVRFVEYYLRAAVMIKLLSRKDRNFLDGARTVQGPFYARPLLIVSDTVT